MIRNIFFFVIIVIINSGCELITVGVKKAEAPVFISLNQKTAEGVLLLFKAELDSNNIWGASQMLALPGGKKYLAIDKYEKHYDILRIKRIFGKYPFSLLKSDSIDVNTRKLYFEINYLKNYNLTAEKIDDMWYIVDLGLNDK